MGIHECIRKKYSLEKISFRKAKIEGIGPTNPLFCSKFSFSPPIMWTVCLLTAIAFPFMLFTFVFRLSFFRKLTWLKLACLLYFLLQFGIIITFSNFSVTPCSCFHSFIWILNKIVYISIIKVFCSKLLTLKITTLSLTSYYFICFLQFLWKRIDPLNYYTFSVSQLFSFSLYLLKSINSVNIIVII